MADYHNKIISSLKYTHILLLIIKVVLNRHKSPLFVKMIIINPPKAIHITVCAIYKTHVYYKLQLMN